MVFLCSQAILLSLVVVIGAEAPYYLPRPAPQALDFHYPSTTTPQPVARPTPSQLHPQQQPNFGYHYTLPVTQMYYQQPALQQQYIPQPQYQPRPQPPTQSGYNYPAPQPLPIILPQPLPQIPPSSSYGVPQLPMQPERQTQHQPALVYQPIPQLAPQPAPQPTAQPAPIFQYQAQQYNQAGYAYQQPLPRSPASLPVQSQALSNNVDSLSSYQADSKQYTSQSQLQSHGDVLDSTVIDQITNIIKENEHNSARDAGYLSLVSGVSLDSAQPSIELSSFVQNSPAESSASSSSQTSAASLLGSPTPRNDYGLPTITANSQSQSSSTSGAQTFSPQPQPTTSYGAPY